MCILNFCFWFQYQDELLMEIKETYEDDKNLDEDEPWEIDEFLSEEEEEEEEERRVHIA